MESRSLWSRADRHECAAITLRGEGRGRRQDFRVGPRYRTRAWQRFGRRQSPNSLPLVCEKQTFRTVWSADRCVPCWMANHVRTTQFKRQRTLKALIYVRTTVSEPLFPFNGTLNVRGPVRMFVFPQIVSNLGGALRSPNNMQKSTWSTVGWTTCPHSSYALSSRSA